MTAISNEGSPRSGKGLMDTYGGSLAYISGMKVAANYPLGYPLLKVDTDYDATGVSSMVTNPLEVLQTMPQVHQRGRKAPVVLALSDIISPVKEGNDYPEKFVEDDVCHIRHEFYTEVESRTMGNVEYRYAVLDWAMQIGKRDNSLIFDAQDLDSIDKRIRVIVNQRNWALSSFHSRGEPFSYVCYDRATMSHTIQDADEESLAFLFDCYDTLARAKRQKVERDRR